MLAGGRTLHELSEVPLVCPETRCCGDDNRLVGSMPIEGKIETVEQLKVPRRVEQLRAFLSMIG